MVEVRYVLASAVHCVGVLKSIPETFETSNLSNFLEVLTLPSKKLLAVHIFFNVLICEIFKKAIRSF
jgi:hypothetical protein